MTLTHELDLHMVKINRHVKTLPQGSFRTKVMMRTHRQTRTQPSRLLYPATKWSVKVIIWS